MKKVILVLACIVALTGTSWGQRSEKTINNAWEFRKAGEQTWEQVNLPHTYNTESYRQKTYYRGPVEYRKTLTINNLDPSLRYYLKIDAANKSAEVSVNGKDYGEHVGGYSAFVHDITPVLKEGANEILVKVDNSRDDIAPHSADFTFFGGIYRDVWLITTPQLHFNMDNHGSEGVFVSTPQVSRESAVVNVKSELVNDTAEKQKFVVRNSLYDKDGQLVQTKVKKLSLKAGEAMNYEWTSDAVANPELWSPDSPTLYRLCTSIEDAKTGEVIDLVENRIGFRWFSIDPEKGFFLNGEHLKLRGASRHQDQRPVGVALDDEAHRRDIALMKEIGCNFIRIAHYPQDDAILDACDELGLIAWEETPIINLVPDSDGYGDRCETMVVDMIRQHYNHPCIVMWGYMNEILIGTRYSNQDQFPAVAERTVKLAERLEAKVREEDPNRLTTMAFHGEDIYNTVGMAITDISGWNVYSGWYYGGLEDFNAFFEDQHSRYPERPIIISEWGAGSDRRIHTDSPKPFDFSIEWQQEFVEHHLRFIEENDYIAGGAYWNFIDFNVASRQESMPRINNKGLFDNDRKPKDVAYFCKALWRDDIPVLHIASRDYPVRVACQDAKQKIRFYSNLDSFELYVNGEFKSVLKPVEGVAIAEIGLPYGTSSLLVRGTKDGKSVSDATTIEIKPLPDLAKGEELAINVGSKCSFISDLSGLTWLPDKEYSEGAYGYVGGSAKSTTNEVTGTQDGPIYQTWMEDIEEYRIDAPAGVYEVELLMFDKGGDNSQMLYLLGRDSGQAAASATTFGVSICGQQVEESLCPSEGKAFMSACRRKYIVRNEDGVIDIKFTPIEGKTVLSAVKIRKK